MFYDASMVFGQLLVCARGGRMGDGCPESTGIHRKATTTNRTQKKCINLKVITHLCISRGCCSFQTVTMFVDDDHTRPHNADADAGSRSWRIFFLIAQPLSFQFPSPIRSFVRNSSLSDVAKSKGILYETHKFI